MPISPPVSREFEKLTESALEVLARIEQHKVQIEELRLQTRTSLPELKALAVEADRLLRKAREIRTDLECCETKQ
jgi:hypothetical protein